MTAVMRRERSGARVAREEYAWAVARDAQLSQK
jgi:hypothetical protein